MPVSRSRRLIIIVLSRSHLRVRPGGGVMAVNHQHLRAFHAIASEGSISRAARRLNLSQPTLSQQLKALEARHHLALFDGRKPPLRLTRSGQDLFALTNRLFQASGAIEEFVGDDAVARLTQLRLGSDSPIYAARMTKALRSDFPELTIKVVIGNARETLKGLVEAQLDAAIVSDPPGDSHYAYVPLFSDRLMAALGVLHPRAREGAYPLSALADDPLLVREATSRTRLATEQLLAAEGVEPRELIELHTRETIREGVAIGLGVSLFLASECPPDPRIAYLSLRPRKSARGPILSGFLVCLAERRRSPVMRRVMALAEALAAAGAADTSAPCPH
jgi:DNA-binding transcriptional LysR family regulator